MKIKEIKIDSISPAAYNPRKMAPDAFERLVKNIQEFGLVDPLIVNADMTLIGGHQRLRALHRLGWSEAPCVVLDLDKTRERLLNIALNRISGEFESSKLKDLLIEISDEGGDLALSGMPQVDLEKLLIPPAPPELKEWDLSESYEPFWIVVRGPVGSYHRVREALSALDLGECVVESSL